MRKLRITAVMTAILFCLLLSAEAQAQDVYGYSSITIDESTNTLTGYASTEVDYGTAYYYDAEVQAEIKDENGNVLATGSNVGNPIASTSFNVFQVLQCIRYSIISYILVRANYWGCDNGGYYDYWGFGYSGWGTYWDYGFFSPNRELRCTFGQAIFIATIIADVIRCVPVNVNCVITSPFTYLRNPAALPSGFRQGYEFPYVSGNDTMNVSCTATYVSGGPASGVLIRFGFGSEVIDSGGHMSNHIGQRPKGTYGQPSVRTNANGQAQTTYKNPPFGGTTRLIITAQNNTDLNEFADAYSMVPELIELPNGPNFKKTGTDTKHPFNHYGNINAIGGLIFISDDYKAEFYSNGFPNDDHKIAYNDISLPKGGKFELSKGASTWKTSGSHDEHRIGINCDTRSWNIPPSRHARLEEIFDSRGSTDTKDETTTEYPHWHLRFEFGNQVAPSSLTSPYNGSPTDVPGIIQAEQFDIGDNGSAFSIPFTGVLSADEKPVNVDFRVAGDGSEYVGSTSGGQWMQYTVNVAATGNYTFETKAASQTSGNTFHFEVDGVDKTGPISIPYTGSEEAFQFVRVDNLPLNAGQQTVRLVIDGSGQNAGSFDYFTISPYNPVQFCNPSSWERNSCNQTGGYWDYVLCECNYGPLGY